MNLHLRKRLRLLSFLGTLLPIAVVMLDLRNAHAGSATWNTNPGSSSWGTPTNWTPVTVPDGFQDTATFAASSTTSVSVSGFSHLFLMRLVFNAGASAFTINMLPSDTLFVWGFGVINNSGTVQTFTALIDAAGNNGGIAFYNSSTAGSLTAFNQSGGVANGTGGASLFFLDTSSAGTATFTNSGGGVNGTSGGFVGLGSNSTASNATFINQGGAVDGAIGGVTQVYNNATAANGTFIANGGAVSGARGGIAFLSGAAIGANGTFTANGGAVSGAYGGEINFNNSVDAGNALLTANGAPSGGGAAIHFNQSSSGGTTRVRVLGNGGLDIVSHASPGVTIGSVEGDGFVNVGGNTLMVGTNDLSTTFSGFIDDSGVMGVFAKIDNGVLTLQGRADNNYIADTMTVILVTPPTLNLNFTGTDTVGMLFVDGVVQPPGLYGTGVAPNGITHTRNIIGTSALLGNGQLLSVLPVAVSREMQGTSARDIYLPMTGTAAIECRNPGPNNSYQIIISFLNAVTFTSASVTSGTGMVTSTSGNGTPTISTNLAGVTNAQRLIVTLFGVNDGTTTRDIPIRMNILIGDTNGNGSVNASDVSQTKGQSGQAITGFNLREDVNGNGAINGSDVALVKSKSGTSLP
jgi:hypothetical protein